MHKPRFSLSLPSSAEIIEFQMLEQHTQTLTFLEIRNQEQPMLFRD